MFVNCISFFNYLVSVEREIGDFICDRGCGKVLDVVFSGLNLEILGIYFYNVFIFEILECNEFLLRYVDEILIL